MAIFKNHKVQLSQLLKIIPDELFSQIAIVTKVDYYAKVLKGKVLFYLLFYALLIEDKLGQRGIADLYSSPHFRELFDIKLEKDTVSHSSISERLSKVKLSYFKKMYAIILERYSSLYPAQTLGGLKLQRVDSTTVSDSSNRIKKSMICGNEYKKGKMLKYTINYDGMYTSFANPHDESKYASESVALPENVIEHFKKSKDHATVYLFDRGQSSAQAFGEMQSNEGLLFVGRLVENRKLYVVKELDLTFKNFGCGILKQDTLVQLYGTKKTISKTGKPVRKQILMEEQYRVIRFRLKEDEKGKGKGKGKGKEKGKEKEKDEDILLITNIFHKSAEQIALIYRRRWDIEVFFRFLK